MAEVEFRGEGKGERKKKKRNAKVGGSKVERSKGWQEKKRGKEGRKGKGV